MDCDYEGTPPELRAIANTVTKDLLPEKSKHLYDKEYNLFKNWCKNHKVIHITENILLAYFTECLTKYLPSSLWPKYSFLRSTLNIYENVDISGYTKLTAWLKRKSKNHQPKKAKVLTEEQIRMFLDSTPTEIYLDVKVITVFALMGALRSDELVGIKMEHVTDLQESNNNENDKDSQRLYFVKIPINKSNEPKSFTIHGNYYPLVKQYLSEYLKLPDPELYTGHSYRRTSATIIANAGADAMTLKRAGKWKSLQVAESYVEESLNSKKKISNMINSAINSHVEGIEILPSTSKTTNHDIDHTTLTSGHTEFLYESNNLQNAEENVTLQNNSLSFEKNATTSQNNFAELLNKRFKFVPKKIIFSVPPPSHSPKYNSSDNIIECLDTDIDSFITECVVDSNMYVSQTDIQHIPEVSINNFDEPSNKRFKFVPKKRIFSVPPPSRSPKYNSSDYIIECLDTDIDNLIIECVVDSSNTYVSQTNVIQDIIPEVVSMPPIPNNFILNNCSVTFHINNPN